MGLEPTPTDCSGQAELVKKLGIVIRNPARQDVLFPGIGWYFKALQLAKDFERASFSQDLRPGSDMLPAQ